MDFNCELFFGERNVGVEKGLLVHMAFNRRHAGFSVGKGTWGISTSELAAPFLTRGFSFLILQLEIVHLAWALLFFTWALNF